MTSPWDLGGCTVVAVAGTADLLYRIRLNVNEKPESKYRGRLYRRVSTCSLLLLISLDIKFLDDLVLCIYIFSNAIQQTSEGTHLTIEQMTEWLSVVAAS